MEYDDNYLLRECLDEANTDVEEDDNDIPESVEESDDVTINTKLPTIQ